MFKPHTDNYHYQIVCRGGYSQNFSRKTYNRIFDWGALTEKRHLKKL
jgi:hypothetical protein